MKIAMKHVFLFGIFGWLYHLRLLHKQEFGNGLYQSIILVLIPKILSQGAYLWIPHGQVARQVKAILVATTQ